MIERNRKLLGLLTEAHTLAQEQQEEAKTSDNLDVRYIGESLAIVKQRLAFLEKQRPATPAPSPEDKKLAAKKTKFLKSVSKASVEELNAMKLEAEKFLAEKPDDEESKLGIQWITELLAEKETK